MEPRPNPWSDSRIVEQRARPASWPPPARQAGGSPALLVLPAASFRSGAVLGACLPLLRSGRRLYCLDGANSFDPYRLARLARAHGLDPVGVLERVLISRAFTCYQLVEATALLLAPLLGEALPALAGILGIDRLFMEEELALGERRALFDRLLARVEVLHRQGLPLFVTFCSPPESPWARALNRLARPLDARDPGLPRLLASFRQRLIAAPCGAAPHTFEQEF